MVENTKNIVQDVFVDKISNEQANKIDVSFTHQCLFLSHEALLCILLNYGTWFIWLRQ